MFRGTGTTTLNFESVLSKLNSKPLSLMKWLYGLKWSIFGFLRRPVLFSIKFTFFAIPYHTSVLDYTEYSFTIQKYVVGVRSESNYGLFKKTKSNSKKSREVELKASFQLSNHFLTTFGLTGTTWYVRTGVLEY